jgi:gliding motility-associated-like protein
MQFLLRRACPIIFLLAGMLFLAHSKVSASHIYGADFFYTYVTGNTYNVTLVVYGDCSGTAFPNLSGATPEVQVLNGSSFYTTITLSQQGPGVEVTPVCPSQLNNTNCVSSTGTIPGVKKFTYSKTVVLNTTSANWTFTFTGDMGTSQAGRSNSITNITVSSTAGSIIQLVATLNNISGPNSSAIYTTIPTPFFCINKPTNYNPGAVDPNGDNLSYSLVAGLEPGGTVTYITPYTSTAPLAASSFSFSATTGQLSFTPNLVQRSLVVTQVSEYRGTTLVGTSMREMTFVVLNNCNNRPPYGAISNISAGTLTNGNIVLHACQSAGLLTFNINPTDSDGNNINVASTGLPAGSSFTVTNNNTTTPTCSFAWNISNVTPGVYVFYVTFTDDGCPLTSKQTIAYTIEVLGNPKLAYTVLSPATCTKKAKLNMTPSGAPSPWTITVKQGLVTIHTFTGLTGTQLDSLNPGNYTIRVTNNNGCFKDSAITIAAPPDIIPAVSMVRPLCNGNNNGSITITGSGGLLPFNYAIGSGSYGSANTFNNLTAGIYTLHIKDSNDCVKDTTVQLTEPGAITATITSTLPHCNYFNSGVVTVTAANGTTPYRYALGTGTFSSTNVFTGLYSGTYTFHIKDSNDCVKDTVYVLNDSVSVHANATVTNILCNGDSTGAITLNAFGTIPPYYYKKGSGTLSTNNVFTTLPAAAYNFHIEDTNHCYLDTIVPVTQPVRLSSTSVVSNVLCNGQANGSITITGAGGILPYKYAFGTGAYGNPNNFSSLSAGAYTLHVKDNNNCIRDTTITITQPAVLTIDNIVATQPSCYNYTNGSFTVSVSGGTTPHTYAVNSGGYSTSNVLGGLGAGTYILHVRDANNCAVDTANRLLGQPTPVVPAAQIKRSTCTPLNNGVVTLAGSGGTPGYTFALGTGGYQASAVFNALAKNTYTFHIQDSKGCIKDTTLNVGDSLVVTAAIAVANTKCYKDSTGAITINAAGGVSPYTYALGSGSFGTANSFNGIPASTYAVHIKDNIGCTKDTSGILVDQPTIIKPAVLLKPISCYGFLNDTITVTATGGTPGYTYSWGINAPSPVNVFTNLGPGIYPFHIKDANDCIHDTTIYIKQPKQLAISVTSTNNNCFGDASGTATVTGTGGTTPYKYAVDGGLPGTTNPITGLLAGPHSIYLTDTNGCKDSAHITLTQPSKLWIDSAHIINPTCDGFTDAAVTIYGNGGVKPYKYAMDNGSFTTTSSYLGLKAGSYTFHLADSNNCAYDTTITLQGYPPINIEAIVSEAVKCFGNSDGSVAITVSGGIPPFTYKLNNKPPGSVTEFTGLPTGSYTIHITDSKNCKKDTSISVQSPDKIETNLTIVPNDCEGDDNGGRITADVKGGTPPYSYMWSNDRTTPDIGGISNGSYFVMIYDNHDCKDSAKADIAYDNCCKIFIPDAFTPNNDGLNDKIRISLKGDFVLKIFEIYNRFGQRVFYTDVVSGRTTEGWDGVYKGIPQDLGTYNYYVKGICGNKGTKEVQYKGTFTLIR